MIRLITLISITCALFFSSLSNAADTPESLAGTTLVSAEKVIDLFDELDELVILDARKDADWNKGHIPDAVHLVNTKTDAASLAAIIETKATPVIIYCNGIKCDRSVKSAQIALDNGYTNIYWFRGGIEEWRAKGFPIEK